MIKNVDEYLKYITGIDFLLHKPKQKLSEVRRKYSFEKIEIILNLNKLKHFNLRDNCIELFSKRRTPEGTQFRDVYLQIYEKLTLKYNKEIKNQKKIMFF